MLNSEGTKSELRNSAPSMRDTVQTLHAGGLLHFRAWTTGIWFVCSALQGLAMNARKPPIRIHSAMGAANGWEMLSNVLVVKEAG